MNEWMNEWSFRPYLGTYRLNWARRTSLGWWDEWDDTALPDQKGNYFKLSCFGIARWKWGMIESSEGAISSKVCLWQTMLPYTKLKSSNCLHIKYAITDIWLCRVDGGRWIIRHIARQRPLPPIPDNNHGAAHAVTIQGATYWPGPVIYVPDGAMPTC